MKANLPPGVHWLDWVDFCQRFGWNAHRQRLLTGLETALVHLRAAGCLAAYVDGSFVTNKAVPVDFDACWEISGVDLVALQGTPLLNFSDGRAEQKATYGGELFPANAQADAAGRRFLDFFQVDKDTGRKKGIVARSLRDIP